MSPPIPAISTPLPSKLFSTETLVFVPNPYNLHDFRAVSLDGNLFQDIDFSDVDFTDANLSECRFIGCSFARATLVDACFIHTLCVGCLFTNAQFENTDATGAQFVSCQFSKGMRGLMGEIDFINTSYN